ncbi:PPE domain-containing protein [Mycobacterium sp.]|uniref:PPE domain-containing protein n=1 Tax=Mycobacterium sp. TaxID=1785 RepID=UPI003F99530B
MDFSALPPEVVSARIHAGPGAESLIEASGAWQRLGTSLEESAMDQCRRVVVTD